MNKVKYNLYTKEKENLGDLTNKYFDGFTIFYGIGYWQNVKEKSAIIEIIGDKDYNTEIKIISLAYDIKLINDQKEVLITREKVETF